MTGERGFTLVETLVAFAILAVVLVALYDAMGTSFRTFHAAAEVNEAVLIAQSQLDRIVALKRLPDETQGKVDGTPFQWRLDIRPQSEAQEKQQANSPLSAVTVRLDVTWPGRARAQSVSLERLLLVPRQPGG
ncbi:MAG: prepilin-type N-terminal cleavage/methylation domain-containing protein [Alphaproteobacteria bacterium]|nr:prepilin-type N-terminal cleavage/methylation domain-containing protein [Alphaproteobacteria bacterium]